MSYHRRSLSGLASRAPGRPVSTSALGAYVPPNLVPGRKMVPSWYQQMNGLGSLGDDTIGAVSTDAQWKADMLAGQRELIAAQKKWAQGDEFQKWIQIGVTAAIPVFAAVWRALGIGRRKTPV